jgi:hypothetical protein
MVGASLRLVKITLLLDGSPVFQLSGDTLASARDFDAFNRRIDVGSHTLTAVAEFQGNGHGVFSYYDGYKYKARSAQQFVVDKARPAQVTVTLFEKGGPLTSVENRLAIAFKWSDAGA